jgi:hypothetical protein
MISIHVDDLLVAGNSREKKDELKAKIHAELGCKDQGPAAFFLGINIYRDRANRKMWLSQENYLRPLLERFNAGQNTSKTMLPDGRVFRVATHKEFELPRHKDYPGLVGSILYVCTVTRQDFAFACSVFCRYISKWSMEHWKAAKHIPHYIRGIIGPVPHL